MYGIPSIHGLPQYGFPDRVLGCYPTLCTRFRSYICIVAVVDYTISFWFFRSCWLPPIAELKSHPPDSKNKKWRISQKEDTIEWCSWNLFRPFTKLQKIINHYETGRRISLWKAPTTRCMSVLSVLSLMCSGRAWKWVPNCGVKSEWSETSFRGSHRDRPCFPRVVKKISYVPFLSEQIRRHCWRRKKFLSKTFFILPNEKTTINLQKQVLFFPLYILLWYYQRKEKKTRGATAEDTYTYLTAGTILYTLWTK